MSSMMSILILVALFAVMYFLMIRPQKKREKETNAMRSGVQVGDEIITIGGICAKVVKTKEESIIIQVGADKIKMEVMRWAVSKIVKESAKHNEVSIEDYEDDEEAAAAKPTKGKPRRMKKAAVEEDTEPVAEEAEASEEVDK